MPDHSRLKILAIATRNAFREQKYRYQIKTALSKQRHELGHQAIVFVDNVIFWEYNPKYEKLKNMNDVKSPTKMNTNHLKSLSSAVLRLLRPLVRLLLRKGISYGTLADWIKWVYVDVAMKEFTITGKKQSTSRVSVLTGLSRKEVKRLKEIPRPDDTERDERYNRAARVISAWRREREFLDADGNPSTLSINGPWATFSEIVRRYSGDVPVRAILDELLRIRAVEELDNGKISLLAKAYIPETNEADKLHILGTDVAHLITTIDHNLKSDSKEEPRLQRKVAYDNLPDEVLPAFRKMSAKRAQALLENLDKWLARQDRDVNPSVQGTGRNVAGLGIYYFEEPYPAEEKNDEN